MKKFIIAIVFMFLFHTNAFSESKGLGQCKENWKVMSKAPIKGKKYCVNYDGSIGEKDTEIDTCGEVLPPQDHWIITRHLGGDSNLAVSYYEPGYGTRYRELKDGSFTVFCNDGSKANHVSRIFNTKLGIINQYIRNKDTGVTEVYISYLDKTVTINNKEGMPTAKMYKTYSGELTVLRHTYDDNGVHIGLKYNLEPTKEEIALYNKYIK